jgi:hypothetical protein
LVTYSPELLAVPTEKNAEGFPEKLDHFKCYRANGFFRRRDVILKDQFVPDGVRTTVLRPFEFCNPVEKTHGDAVTPINNPTAHLVCYVISPLDIEAVAATRNQFRTEDQQRIGAADMLCVPTEKLGFSVILANGGEE